MADPAAAGLLLGVGATLQHATQYADAGALGGADGGDAWRPAAPAPRDARLMTHENSRAPAICHGGAMVWRRHPTSGTRPPLEVVL